MVVLTVVGMAAMMVRRRVACLVDLLVVGSVGEKGDFLVVSLAKKLEISLAAYSVHRLAG